MKPTLIAATAVLLLLAVRPVSGTVLLTDEQAWKELLPGADKYSVKDETLTADQVKAVKGQLGDKWYLYPPAAGSKEATENPAIEFHFAVKAGKETGVVLFETQPGKHGPVKFAVALDLTGKVTGVAVTAMAEKRGKPIATKRFLSQFNGKTLKSPITVGKDIDAVSGATISSRASAFAVKKAIALYDAVYCAPAAGGK